MKSKPGKTQRQLKNERAMSASVAHIVGHALQFDLQKRNGFAVYRISENPGEITSDSDISNLDDDRMVFRFTGFIVAPRGFRRYYAMEVVIRTHDDEPKVRYERLVNLLLLDENTGNGLEYVFYVPIIGEKDFVHVHSVNEITAPDAKEFSDDILQSLWDLPEFNNEDHSTDDD